MLMADLTRQPMELPVDGEQYDALLKDLTLRHGGKKIMQTTKPSSAEMSGSF